MFFVYFALCVFLVVFLGFDFERIVTAYWTIISSPPVHFLESVERPRRTEKARLVEPQNVLETAVGSKISSIDVVVSRLFFFSKLADVALRLGPYRPAARLSHVA